MRCSADFVNNNIKMSGSYRVMNQDMESLWLSLLPRNATFDRGSDDDILKLSLLLKSTEMLVTGLHQKQQCVMSQLKLVQGELKIATDLKEKSELDKNTLSKELQVLKAEFQSAEEKAKKYQKEAEVAAAKNERLQTKITTEVETRLHKMFNNCLQQNKAATVLDMMTQMGHENITEEEEMVLKRPIAERVANLKSTATSKLNDIGSPDVIPATPPISAQKGRKSNMKIKKSKPHQKPTIEHQLVDSAQSSPDVIDDTPPSTNNRKRYEKCMRLFKCEEVESELERKPVVFVKDTQDEDDFPEVPPRPTLKDNVIVPETLDPDIYEMKLDKIPTENSAQNNKENENVLLNKNDEKPGKIADLSTDAEFPSTPKKSLLQEDNSKSPILGRSGHKGKTSSRHSSLSAEMSTSSKSPNRNRQAKKRTRSSLDISKSIVSNKSINRTSKNSSQNINNSFLIEDDLKTSYDVRPNQKILKSKQPTIFDAFSKESHNKSKLSLSKRKKDISSRPEFNGGQRSVAEHSFDVSNLSENEQVKIAIENSMRESRLDDTDATIFIPNSNSLNRKSEVAIKDNELNTKSTTEALRSTETKLSEAKEVLFEPMYASTAREDFSQFKHASNFSSDEAAAIGKPLYSSTEKVVDDDNSALKELQKYLEENNSEDDMEEDLATGCVPETSYDRLPQKNNSPNYAYKGPAVRKKNERKNLQGFDCSKCVEYYEAAFAGDNEKAKKIILNGCSRHRDKGKNGPRPRTPPGFWDLDFPPTQVLKKRQQATQSPS